jgi:4-aminobutyrate aminotransferase
MPLVGDVRGHGLMLGVEFVSDKAKKTPAGELRDKVVEHAFEKGVLYLGAGPNTLRIAPPLVVSAEQIDIALDILEESIRAVAALHEKGAKVGQPSGS